MIIESNTKIQPKHIINLSPNCSFPNLEINTNEIHSVTPVFTDKDNEISSLTIQFKNSELKISYPILEDIVHDLRTIMGNFKIKENK